MNQNDQTNIANSVRGLAVITGASKEQTTQHEHWLHPFFKMEFQDASGKEQITLRQIHSEMATSAARQRQKSNDY